jgi:cell division transport system permease protein
MSLPARDPGEYASSTEFLKEYGRLIIDASNLIEKLGTTLMPSAESRNFTIERIEDPIKVPEMVAEAIGEVNSASIAYDTTPEASSTTLKLFGTDKSYRMAEVKKLSSVTDVAVQTPDQARENFIQDNKADNATLDAVKEATNKFPWTIKIQVEDINDTSQLASLVKDNAVVKAAVDSDRDPSFAGQRREAIEKIAGTAAFAQRVGIIISVVFVAISTLIIFNTIRMAIFNRREEIQMMKLIGAERSFIRGPFIVEAVVYGFFAAVLASAIGFGLFIFAKPALESAGVAVAQTESLLTIYAGFVLLGMILVGAIIGIISSLLATRRYLKL